MLTAAFCQTTSTVLMLTAVYMHYILWFGQFVSYSSYLYQTEPNYNLVLTVSLPPQYYILHLFSPHTFIVICEVTQFLSTVTLLTVSAECWLWYTLLNVRMCAKVTGAKLWDFSQFHVNDDYRFIFSNAFIKYAHIAILNLRKLLYSYWICVLPYWICARYYVESVQIILLNIPW
jgi:hypothetical protein